MHLHAIRDRMRAYYEDRLSGERLRKCYEMAPSRIRRYLEAEIAFAVDKVRGPTRVLELGCGYGRILRKIAPSVSAAVGCDTSRPSLELARTFLAPFGNVALVRSDAARLAFAACTFDVVLCLQNGISAFGVDRGRLVAEALRVTRPSGFLLFSSYSPRIWEARLEWFRLQARAGLIGEIDEDQTADGTIVCKDGFRASTVGGEAFVSLFEGLGRRAELFEVDESILFCLVTG